MNTEFLEEEVDILESVFDNLDMVLSMLKELPSKEYKLTISQIQEILNDIDYKFAEKQVQLEQYDKQRFIEERLERYEKELNYQYNKIVF